MGIGASPRSSASDNAATTSARRGHPSPVPDACAATTPTGCHLLRIAAMPRPGRSRAPEMGQMPHVLPGWRGNYRDRHKEGGPSGTFLASELLSGKRAGQGRFSGLVVVL